MPTLRQTLIAMLVAASVAACAYTQAVQLKNRQTGKIVTCGPYRAPPLRASANVMQQNQCVQDFGRQGFVRIAP